MFVHAKTFLRVRFFFLFGRNTRVEIPGQSAEEGAAQKVKAAVAASETAAYRKKKPASPRRDATLSAESATLALVRRLVKTASVMSRARSRSGATSETTTHVNGPTPSENVQVTSLQARRSNGASV